MLFVLLASRDMDAEADLRHTAAMQTSGRIGSQKMVNRLFEQWKRGAAVAALVAIGLLPGAVAGAVAMLLGEILLSETAGVFAGVLAFATVGPWGLGQPVIGRQIGGLIRPSG